MSRPSDPTLSDDARPSPLSVTPALLDVLRGAYAQPERAYHNLDHVAEVVDHYCRVSKWKDPISVGLAILFHDAIYEPGRSDNEQRSADFAEQVLRANPPEVPYEMGRVRALIELTSRHGSLTEGDVDREAALFLDCDMAILGAERPRFIAYEQAIRTEYAHLPDAAYRAGRSSFLRRLLELPSIFLSSTFRQRYEAQARENVAWALARLSEPT